MDFSKYENVELCKECGGFCCKNSGCYYHPQDFPQMDLVTLQKELDSGKITITGDIHFSFFFSFDVLLCIKARNKDENAIELFVTPGECGSLTETGCKFSIEERPTGGRMLIPHISNGTFFCQYEGIDENDIVLAWAPYQDILRKLILINTNMDYLTKTREDVFQAYCRFLSQTIDKPKVLNYMSRKLLSPQYLITFKEEYKRAKMKLELKGFNK